MTIPIAPIFTAATSLLLKEDIPTRARTIIHERLDRQRASFSAVLQATMRCQQAARAQPATPEGTENYLALVHETVTALGVVAVTLTLEPYPIPYQDTKEPNIGPVIDIINSLWAEYRDFAVRLPAQVNDGRGGNSANSPTFRPIDIGFKDLDRLDGHFTQMQGIMRNYLERLQDYYMVLDEIDERTEIETPAISCKTASTYNSA